MSSTRTAFATATDYCRRLRLRHLRRPPHPVPDEHHLSSLPYDCLLQIYSHLPIADLLSVSALGEAHFDAAQQIARRQGSGHVATIDIPTVVAAATRSPDRLTHICQFYTGVVRRMTINFAADGSAGPPPPLTVADCAALNALISAAPDLRRLRLTKPMLNFRIGPRLLERIEWLELIGVSDCDDFVLRLLETTRPSALRYLHIEQMCLSGSFLAALDDTPLPNLVLWWLSRFELRYLNGYLLKHHGRVRQLDLRDRHYADPEPVPLRLDRLMSVAALKIFSQSTHLIGDFLQLAWLTKLTHLEIVLGAEQKRTFNEFVQTKRPKFHRMRSLFLTLRDTRFDVDTAQNLVDCCPNLESLHLQFAGDSSMDEVAGDIMRTLGKFRNLWLAAVWAELGLDMSVRHFMHNSTHERLQFHRLYPQPDLYRLAFSGRLRVLEITLTLRESRDEGATELYARLNQLLFYLCAGNLLERLKVVLPNTGEKFALALSEERMSKWTSLRSLKFWADVDNEDKFKSLVWCAPNLRTFKLTAVSEPANGTKPNMVRTALKRVYDSLADRTAECIVNFLNL